MNSETPVSLALHIVPMPDDTDDDVEARARQLRSELDDAAIGETTSAPASAAPHGSKSAHAFTIGAFALAVAPVAIPKLVELLQGWLLRDRRRPIKIKAQVGDRIIELEYSADSVAGQDLKALARDLATALGDTQHS